MHTWDLFWGSGDECSISAGTINSGGLVETKIKKKYWRTKLHKISMTKYISYLKNILYLV